jgi:multidrug efflux system outer membrane protein
VPADLLPDGLGQALPTVADVPAGLSSDVLLSRPDVLEAEHQLKADNANIGAARAAFFPAIQLTGAAGTASVSLSSLFGPNTGAWTFTPTVTLPIFAGGKNRANLRLAEVQRDTTVAQYEKSVQTAFREVADALARRGTIDEQLAAQEDLVDASSRSLGLSQLRYRRGSDTYLNTLTAELSVYSARQTLISTRLARALNLVTLYQTLGGGVR